MNIRTLEIDFDKGILKCNGKSYTERPVIVTLPGPDDNFKYSKLFNENLATGNKEEYDRLEVTYTEAVNNKPR